MFCEAAKISEPTGCYQHQAGPNAKPERRPDVSKQLKLTAGRTQSACKFCGEKFIHRKSSPGIYCSLHCKSQWQRTQKPVDREWLYEKYVVEGRSCPEIAKIVSRHPKCVWFWLKDLDIPTRPRGHCYASNLAFCFWKDPNGVNPFKGKSHTAENRKYFSDLSIATGRVPFDPAIGPPLKGKRGAEVHTWKGGVTPERQSFYSSTEWKAVIPQVWQRDNATCQNCACRNLPGKRFSFDIHHIVSFACRELRAELSNLVLLCEKCHYWVHSSENTEGKFIRNV